MSYRIYVDKLLMPIAPEKISIQISNRNETVDLINGGEVNILKSPGLSEISFDVLLPANSELFAVYLNGFKPIQKFLKKFETLKLNKKHFPLVITRTFPNGKISKGKNKGKGLHGNSIVVTLEEYEIIDDVEYGFDTMVSLSFKQYKAYGTQKAKIKLPCTYKTVKGDTLVKIAKRFYGTSKDWKKIYKANKKKVKKKSKKSLKKGIKLKIPA